VASAIAGVLNVQESGNRPIDDLLVAYLVERSVLLTLDTFEHVLASSLVVKLLESALGSDRGHQPRRIADRRGTGRPRAAAFAAGCASRRSRSASTPTVPVR
jgi:hypothetical protein